MLIKVMTNRNTQRIIQNVTDVEIHESGFQFVSDRELHDTLTKGPGVFRTTGLSPSAVHTFDESIDNRSTGGPEGVRVRFVDYEKDGQWHRLAVECFAYICNDEGRTIAKVA